ncbi:MAG: PepSY-associated TM helix domain-containing protein [Acidobacteriota bacterium]
MKRDAYRWIRDLHLYFGLFVSPFILVFAASVFFLNHGKVVATASSPPETFRGLRIPEGIEQLQGREAVDRAREILPQVGLTGEIGFLRVLRKEGHLVFPVSKPGFDATVNVDVASRSAVVSRRTSGWWEALAYLHKSPGPHNVNLRGNWFWTRAWGWLADTTIYLTLFISISGLYLWYAIKAERIAGLWLLGAGAASYLGIMYAVVR